MIDSMIGACETLVSAVCGKGRDPLSRISRVGMPNGFFLNDLLWFGDGASRKTAISRGFMVEPGEISAFSVTQLNDLHERLRILLGILLVELTLNLRSRTQFKSVHIRTLLQGTRVKICHLDRRILNVPKQAQERSSPCSYGLQKKENTSS